MIPKENVHEAANGYHVTGPYTIPGYTPNGDIKGTYDETVPFSEAMPSPDGEYWRCKRPDGSRRCFFAPPPSY